MAQAPANSNALGMGRPLFDRAALESALAAGNWTALVEAMISIQDALTGMGYACGAKDGDEKYQNVVAQFVDPDWVLYAGRPDTPLTPDVIPGLAGGGEITIERDNSVIQGAATIINFSTNFSVVDAGGGQVDVDVTGGGGGTTYTASTPLVISGGNDISLTIGFGLTETADTLVFNNGHGLEDNGSGAVRVKAHTLIDVDANGVSVDFTEGSGYSGSGDQYWRNNNGTFQWATLPAPDGVGYDEILDNGSALTKRAKLNIIGAASIVDNAGSGRTDVTISTGNLVIGMVTKTIAGATAMNGTAITATAGRSADADAVTLMTGDPSSLTALQEDLGAGDVNAVRRGATFSKSDFRASTSEPILMWGKLETYDSGDGEEEHFVIVGPFDMRSFVGHSSTDEQGPYHPAGSNKYELGRSSC